MRNLKYMAVLLAIIVSASIAAGEPRPSSTTPALEMPASALTQTESWWRKILRIAGISAAPTRQRAPTGTPMPGDIYIYDLARKSERRIATGNYSSPIFLAGGDRILALRGGDIFSIPITGGAAEIFPNRSGITKLVGQSLDDRNLVLVLTGNGQQTSVGTLSLADKSVTVIPHETETDEGKFIFSQLADWNRTYCGTEVFVELKCEIEPQTGECKRDATGKIKKQWTDVMAQRPYKDPINISDCKGDNCSQPSLSLDGQYAAYIRTGR
ncbi:MAG TPA: hypothetical protein VF543_03600 [Pyrinomonadaceae bacterium]|jgi:hypothetical protein